MEYGYILATTMTGGEGDDDVLYSGTNLFIFFLSPSPRQTLLHLSSHHAFDDLPPPPDPNVDSPLNGYAADLWKDQKSYESIVRLKYRNKMAI
jgi:hypothetical protein